MACTHCDVLVVGGGAAGTATAATAAACGLSTCLVAPRAAEVTRPDGRAIALMASARDRLIDLDLWRAIDAHAWPVAKVRVEDADNGREHVYSVRSAARSALFHGLDHSHLRRCLRALVKLDGRVQHLAGRRLTGLQLEVGWRRAQLDDGSVVRARLVVGADGRQSPVREAVGLTARRTELAQTALVFAVEGDALEPTTVLERLLPEGPISVLPVAADQFSVAWVVSTTTAQRRRHLAPKALLRELAQCLELPAAASMRLATPVLAHRLGLAHADRYVAPRLVLVGDAAHGAHPVHAQGFNMAIADVHELAMLWRAEGRRFASAEALARFQRNRRLANAARLGLTDVMNRLFQPSTAPFAFLQATEVAGPIAPESAKLHPAEVRRDGQRAG